MKILCSFFPFFVSVLTAGPSLVTSLGSTAEQQWYKGSASKLLLPEAVEGRGRLTPKMYLASGLTSDSDHEWKPREE